MYLNRTNEIRLATLTLWEAAAIGKAEQVSLACLESARSPKLSTGKPWSCPGVNDKTPGLGFTPLHACMAGLAAVTRGLDVCPPCTPSSRRPCRRQGRGPDVAPPPSVYNRLTRVRNGTTPEDGKGDTRKSGIQDTQTWKGDMAQADPYNGYLVACRTLLSAAADVQALDARCRTPLALAAAAGSLEVVEMLLEAGADPCAVDADGNTPVHFALAYANAAIAAALVNKGANLEACNGDDKTPQDVAGLGKYLAPSKSGV